ncbi:hypothetical protein D3C83_09200 [compost metagenome]
MQRAADAAALRARRRADHLQPESGPGAAELALEHARQRIPGKRRARLLGRELHVQLGLAQRGGEAPLEIGPPRAARDGGIQRHDLVEVGARELPDLQFT